MFIISTFCIFCHRVHCIFCYICFLVFETVRPPYAHRMLIVCLPHAQVLVHRSDCLSLLNDCTACTYRSLSPRSINVCGTVVRVFNESVVFKVNLSCESIVFIVFWRSHSPFLFVLKYTFVTMELTRNLAV